MSTKDFADQLSSRVRSKPLKSDELNDKIKTSNSEHNNPLNRAQISNKGPNMQDSISSASIGDNSASGVHGNFKNGHVIVSKPDNPVGQNKSSLKSFSKLKGNNKKVILLIYQICKLNRSNVTVDLSREDISKFCGINFNSVKTTISRLLKYGCLIRQDYSAGVLGGTKYQLPYHIYQEMAILEVNSRLDLDFLPKTLFELGNNVRTQAGDKIFYQ